MWIDNIEPFKDLTEPITIFSYNSMIGGGIGGIGTGQTTKTSFKEDWINAHFFSNHSSYKRGMVSLGSTGSVVFSYDSTNKKINCNSTGLNTFSLYLFYSYENVKTLKFKNKENEVLLIQADKTNRNISVTNGVGANIKTYNDASSVDDIYNSDYFCMEIVIIGDNFSTLYINYVAEINIENYNEPYYWDNKDWTPNQLKFSSIVKYSSILTEDKNDAGSTTSLPETSSATGASNYEHDENGYCYIKDSEGNIVYNKFLNPLARKTKINNGYRINGNQSLELLSFGNNIYDIEDKTEGQFLFNGTKTQEYGEKRDNEVLYTRQQNIPYFGGQPAIYPVIIYNDMNVSSPSNIKIHLTSDQLIITDSTYNSVIKSININSKDKVLAYIRNESVWTIDAFPWDWSSGQRNQYEFNITSKDISFNISPPTIDIYSISNGSYLWDNSNNIFQNKNNLEFYRKIIDTTSYSISLSLTGKSSYAGMTEYTDYDKYNVYTQIRIGSYKDFWDPSLTATCNIVASGEISVPSICTTPLQTIFSSNSSASCITNFTATKSSWNGDENHIFIGSYISSFSSFSGVFPEALYISTKTNKGQININGVNYEYNELVQKEIYDSFKDDNMSLSTYLNIGWKNTNYKKHGLAIVVWKNGKLLEENS